MTAFSTKATELVDITTLSEADWHEWRRKGIGGSDLAAIMGLSPWATARDIFRKKKGIKGALDDEADRENWVAKKVGHLLEPLVAEIFAHQTGFVPFEVRKMFAHPDYPYMLANVDFFFTLPDGRTAILECKTSNSHAKEKWDDDAVPLNYELQCRHYMAVMDVDVVFIACLYGNNENDFVWRRIERDMDFEADIIAAEKDFWTNYVLPGIEPPYTENGDLVLRSIRNHFGRADVSAGEVELPVHMADSLSEYLSAKAQKSVAEKTVAVLKEKMEKAQAVFVEGLGTSCKAVCRAGDEEFIITYNPVMMDEVDKDGLKANHPDVYDKYIKKQEKYRRLNVKKTAIKKEAAA